jgi:hypothetical protein
LGQFCNISSSVQTKPTSLTKVDVNKSNSSLKHWLKLHLIGNSITPANSVDVWKNLFLAAKHIQMSRFNRLDSILMGLSKGGFNFTSVDLSHSGLWSRCYGFARNTAAILKSAKKVSTQYNTRMYICWVTLKARWFSACSKILL